MKVVALRPSAPLTVGPVFDFGQWSVAFYQGGRFKRRDYYDNEQAARAACRELIATGECRPFVEDAK